MKRIIFTVTNDLSYDQRMQRICTSLAKNNYDVLLIGRRLKTSINVKQQVFHQKRLRCWFNTSALFYAEYNLRLFFYLLFKRVDIICAIDLDTILACYFASIFKRTKRVYDAHELFTELKEVVTRQRIKTAWLTIERFTVKRFTDGYTVSKSIAEELHKRYGVSYEVIRNLPQKVILLHKQPIEKFLLYQGAVNEARGLEVLIEAMAYINMPLHIYGNGNIYQKIKQQIITAKLSDKVFLKGVVKPEVLQLITQQAYGGINLVEPVGLNQLYSLANKFFDYMQCGIPQLTMNFVEYKKVNAQFEVAVLLEDLTVKEVTDKLNLLITNTELHERLKYNCLQAREVFNWEQEEQRLLSFYNRLR